MRIFETLTGEHRAATPAEFIAYELRERACELDEDARSYRRDQQRAFQNWKQTRQLAMDTERAAKELRKHADALSPPHKQERTENE